MAVSLTPLVPHFNFPSLDSRSCPERWSRLGVVARTVSGFRPAGRRRHALLPMRGGGCGGASGHPRNAAAPLGMGEVRRTPPHADSPHSCRLTRWGGAGTAASKPLPLQRAPPTQILLTGEGAL